MSNLPMKNNPLHLDLWQPQWKRLLQKLDMVYYQCSMPFLENVQVSLAELLAIRAGPLKEPELWALLCQSVEAIQDVFLKGYAHKGEGPAIFITPNTLMFCVTGRVLYSAISEEKVKYTIYESPEMFALRETTDESVEKMLIFSLGVTLRHGAEYTLNTKHVPRLSPLLNTTLRSMHHPDPTLRLNLLAILNIAAEHAHKYTYGRPYSYFISYLYKEVLSNIPEREILAQVDKDIAKEVKSALPENQMLEMHSAPDGHSDNSKNHQHRRRSSAFSCFLDEDKMSPEPPWRTVLTRLLYEDHKEAQNKKNALEEDLKYYKHTYGRRLEYRPPKPAPFVASKVSDLSPREKWLWVMARVTINNRKNGMQINPKQKGFSTLNKKYANHRAKSSIFNVYEQLKERKRLMEMLRLDINLPFDVRASNLSRVTDSQKPGVPNLRNMTLCDVVSKLKNNQGLHSCTVSGKSNHKTDASEKASDSKQNCEETKVTSDDGSIFAKESVTQTKKIPVLKKTYYQIENYPKLIRHYLGPIVREKTVIGPEFIVMSCKPPISIPLCNAKEKDEEMVANKTGPKQILVVLLNGQRIEFTCDPLTVVARDIFQAVVKHQNIAKRFLFGLAYLRDGEFLFMDSDTKLHKIAPIGWKENSSKMQVVLDSFTVYFRIKFYVNISLIRHPSTKHLIYLQLRRDILEERTRCSPSLTLKIAAFALQAEFGDYNEDILGKDYFLTEHYLPIYTIRTLGREHCKEELIKLHCGHLGLSEDLAELEFITEIQDLPEFGFHFHTVLQDKKDWTSIVWLGISSCGIHVFNKEKLDGEERAVIQKYDWAFIKRFSYGHNCFYLVPHLESLTGKFVKYKFYTDNYKSKYLFQIAMSHHRLYLKASSLAKASEIFWDDYDNEHGRESEDWNNEDLQEDQEITYDLNCREQKKLGKVLSHRTRNVIPLISKTGIFSSERISRNSSENGLAAIILPPSVMQINDKLEEENPDAVDESVNSETPFVIDEIDESHFSFLPEESISDSLAERFANIDGSPERNIVQAVLPKSKDCKLGLTLVGGKQGVFIQSITPNSIAYMEGTLKSGDYLLSVNGKSVEGLAYHDVVELIRNIESDEIILIVSQSQKNNLSTVDEEDLNDADILLASPLTPRIFINEKDDEFTAIPDSDAESLDYFSCDKNSFKKGENEEKKCEITDSGNVFNENCEVAKIKPSNSNQMEISEVTGNEIPVSSTEIPTSSNILEINNKEDTNDLMEELYKILKPLENLNDQLSQSEIVNKEESLTVHQSFNPPKPPRKKNCKNLSLNCKNDIKNFSETIQPLTNEIGKSHLDYDGKTAENKDSAENTTEMKVLHNVSSFSHRESPQKLAANSSGLNTFPLNKLRPPKPPRPSLLSPLKHKSCNDVEKSELPMSLASVQQLVTTTKLPDKQTVKTNDALSNSDEINCNLHPEAISAVSKNRSNEAKTDDSQIKIKRDGNEISPNNSLIKVGKNNCSKLSFKKQKAPSPPSLTNTKSQILLNEDSVLTCHVNSNVSANSIVFNDSDFQNKSSLNLIREEEQKNSKMLDDRFISPVKQNQEKLVCLSKENNFLSKQTPFNLKPFVQITSSSHNERPLEQSPQTINKEKPMLPPPPPVPSSNVASRMCFSNKKQQSVTIPKTCPSSPPPVPPRSVNSKLCLHSSHKAKPVIIPRSLPPPVPPRAPRMCSKANVGNDSFHDCGMEKDYEILNEKTIMKVIPSLPIVVQKPIPLSPQSFSSEVKVEEQLAISRTCSEESSEVAAEIKINNKENSDDIDVSLRASFERRSRHQHPNTNTDNDLNNVQKITEIMETNNDKITETVNSSFSSLLEKISEPNSNFVDAQSNIFDQVCTSDPISNGLLKNNLANNIDVGSDSFGKVIDGIEQINLKELVDDKDLLDFHTCGQISDSSLLSDCTNTALVHNGKDCKNIKDFSSLNGIDKPNKMIDGSEEFPLDLWSQQNSVFSDDLEENDEFSVPLELPENQTDISEVGILNTMEDDIPFNDLKKQELDDDKTNSQKALHIMPGDVYHVVLEKSWGSLGLNISASSDSNSKESKNVIVKSIVEGGAADLDGRIKIGDVILEVSGTSLVGVSHQQAVETLRSCSQVAHLTLQRGPSTSGPTTVRLRRPDPQHFPRLSTLCEESGVEDELNMGAKATTPKGPPPSTPPIVVGSMPGDVILYPVGTIHEGKENRNRSSLKKRVGSVDNLFQSNQHRNMILTNPSNKAMTLNPKAIHDSFQDQNQFRTRITVNPEKNIKSNVPHISERYLTPSNSWATKITVNNGSSPAKITVNNNSPDVIRLHVSFTNDDASSLPRRHSCGSESPYLSHRILYPSPSGSRTEIDSRGRRRSSSCGSLSDTVTLSSVSSAGSSGDSSSLLPLSLDPSRRPSQAPRTAPAGSVYLNPFWDDNSSEGTNSHSGSPLLPKKDKPTPQIWDSNSRRKGDTVDGDFHWKRCYSPDITTRSINNAINHSSTFTTSLPKADKALEERLNLVDNEEKEDDSSSTSCLLTSNEDVSEKDNISTSARTRNQSDKPSIDNVPVKSPPVKILVTQYDKDFSEGESPVYEFPFITEENTFEVALEKNSRGLGLSVCGGWDTDPSDRLAALIRIKRLYPLQPAVECGRLNIGDIILAVNGRELTGLTYFEAIEVLRMAPPSVVLEVCRPENGILPPIPQSTSLLGSAFLSASSPCVVDSTNNGYRGVSYSEFDVTLTKINGSLGFTLVKLEGSKTGHYIKALVKEPALTDGQLRPGDRLIWVNGVDISEMSHAEAIKFLRDAPDEVTLCVWRETTAPVSPLSPLSPMAPFPEEAERKKRPKPMLRKEAMDMLSDKSRKKAGCKKGSSPLGSPRNRREQRYADSKTNSLPTTLRRDEEEESVQRTQPLPLPDGPVFVAGKDDDIMATSVDSGLKMDDAESSTEPIDIPARREMQPDGDEEAESFATADAMESPRPQRPSFLDLTNNSLSPRKQMFGRGLLAPPPLCGQRDTPDSDSFSSIHYLDSGDSMFATDDNLTTVTSSEDSPLRSSTASSSVGNSALLKWRGTTLTSNEEAAEQTQVQEPSVMTVELERGWNSRLGFSLVGMGSGERAGTFVRVIYPGSVAAHDGRLKVGDKLIQVNGTCVRTMSVDDIIELLRKTRGKINLTVERAPDNFRRRPQVAVDDNETLPRSQSHQEEILSNDISDLNAKNNNVVNNFRWETRPSGQDENENYAGRTNVKVNI